MAEPLILFKGKNLIWNGDFTLDADIIKRNTSIHYICTYLGELEYMSNFGQPILLKMNNFLTPSEYLKYIESQTFQIDINSIEEFNRIRSNE